MAIQPEVSYIPYYTSSRKKTGDIITFTQFEEGILISESCNSMESSDEYDKDSTLPPLISEAKMDEISSGDASDAEPMPSDML